MVASGGEWWVRGETMRGGSDTLAQRKLRFVINAEEV